jgi:hypothetical protein
MNTLTITIGILAPVITFLIGRYFRAEKIKQLIKGIEYAKAKFSDLEGKISRQSLELGKEISYLKMQVGIASKALVDLNECESLLYEVTRKFPKFELVPNKDKHPAANDNYLYIEGEINGNREAGLFTLNDWSKAKKRLLKNPEDKPL